MWPTRDSAGFIFGTFVVTAVFACVLAHEMGHALVAKQYGLSVHDVTLLPIGGVARIEHGALTPRTETVIALAGPLVNVAIAGLLTPLVVAVAVVTSASEALGYLIYAEQLSVNRISDLPLGGKSRACLVQSDPSFSDGRRPDSPGAARGI